MILSPHKLKIVYNKTDGRCAICGGYKNIVCTSFIPEWTRIQNSVDNQIPLCDDCIAQKGFNFIELGKLRYLDKLYIEVLMRYYDSESNYIKAYVRRFGKYRTFGVLDVDYALSVLGSYDEYIRTHHDILDWDKLGR